MSRQDSQSSVPLPSHPGFVNSGPIDPQTIPESPARSSPGNPTLATLRREAIKERRQTRWQIPSRTRGPPSPKRRVGRIMKEEYFDSMPWTRTFLSGPVDPKWNPHKIYCQICNCNVSIRAKGSKDFLRHYATERHLCRDQRWRYEHLTIEDPLTNRPR